jgi:hypothetical protein
MAIKKNSLIGDKNEGRCRERRSWEIKGEGEGVKGSLVRSPLGREASTRIWAIVCIVS